MLRVENLVRSFGGIKATDNLSLDVQQGELHAIIGPNGAGKTTLISQLTGQLMPNSGSIRLGDQDITHVPGRGEGSWGGGVAGRRGAAGGVAPLPFLPPSPVLFFFFPQNRQFRARSASP